jgi:hypothetical protein
MNDEGERGYKFMENKMAKAGQVKKLGSGLKVKGRVKIT